MPNTLLNEIVRKKDIEIATITAFLKENPHLDINAPDENNYTPIMAAIEVGRLDISEYFLLLPQILIQKVKFNNLSTLVIAVKAGNVDALDQLFQHFLKREGGQKHLKNIHGLLKIASDQNDIQCIEKLLYWREILNVDKKLNWEFLGVLKNELFKNNDKILKLLLSYIEKIDIKKPILRNKFYREKTTRFLHLAIEWDRYGVVSVLLSWTANFNVQRFFESFFPILSKEMILVFLQYAEQHQQDVFNFEIDKKTLLMHAIENNWELIVDYLLTKSGIDLYYQSEEQNALSLATQKRQINTVLKMINYFYTTKTSEGERWIAYILKYCQLTDVINWSVDGNFLLTLVVRYNINSLISTLIAHSDISIIQVESALWVAIQQSQIEAVKKILFCADQEKKEVDHLTVLTRAVEGSFYLAIPLLLYYVDIKGKTSALTEKIYSTKQTALMLIVRYGSLQMVEAILAAKKEKRICHVDRNYENVFVQAIIRDDLNITKALFKHFIKTGQDTSMLRQQCLQSQDSLFMKALSLNRKKMIEELITLSELACTFTLDLKNRAGQTAVLLAAKENNFDILQLFFIHAKKKERESVFLEEDNSGHTPFFWAIQLGCTEILDFFWINFPEHRDSLLYECKKEVDVYYSESAVFCAIKHNNLISLEWLLKREGLDINKRCKSLTPLMLAAQTSSVEIIRALLNHRDINICLKQEALGYSALDFAVSNLNVLAVVELLNFEKEKKEPLDSLSSLKLAKEKSIDLSEKLKEIKDKKLELEQAKSKEILYLLRYFIQKREPLQIKQSWQEIVEEFQKKTDLKNFWACNLPNPSDEVSMGSNLRPFIVKAYHFSWIELEAVISQLIDCITTFNMSDTDREKCKLAIDILLRVNEFDAEVKLSGRALLIGTWLYCNEYSKKEQMIIGLVNYMSPFLSCQGEIFSINADWKQGVFGELLKPEFIVSPDLSYESIFEQLEFRKKVDIEQRSVSRSSGTFFLSPSSLINEDSSYLKLPLDKVAMKAWN